MRGPRHSGCPDAMAAGSAALLAAIGERAVCGPTRPVVRGIVRHAATMAEIGEAAILGRARQQRLVRLRHAVVWVAQRQAEAGDFVLSLPQIGSALGGRDHSTIINSRDRAAALIERDPEFAWLCERLWAAADCEPWGPASPWRPATVPAPEFVLEDDPDEEDDAADEARADCAMRRVSDAMIEALAREHPEKVVPLAPPAPRAEAARAGYVRVAA